MSPPINDLSQSTSQNLYLTWTASTTDIARGGAGVSITTYEVDWDQGTGTWTTLVSTSNTYTNVLNLVGG